MLHYTLVFLILFCTEAFTSRVRIEENAYKDILISLPDEADEDERSQIVQNVEDMMRSSSVLVQMATKGRAYFSEVSLLVPENWNIGSANERKWASTPFNSTTFCSQRAALTADDADVVVTAKGQYPYVLHQGGCGRHAMRIILPKDFLLRSNNKGTEFARLWSEYRYGVFPEGGFQDDEMYPAKYRSPKGNEIKTTGCSDKTLWSSNLCNEDDKKCAENSLTSSLMDQHLSSAATLFCEGSLSLGPKHNPESPSKHNLLCKEEGTWFTVMKNSDFANGKNVAPKYLRHATDVSFRFVQEGVAPKVIVAIDVSSRMLPQNRYILTQAAFYHFIYSTLPYGSEVTLFVFGDEEGVKLAKEKTVIKGEDSRLLYIESQPLPEEASSFENISLSQLLDEIFQSNETKLPSSTIIVVTTAFHVNASAYARAKQKIIETESRLHVLLFHEHDAKAFDGIPSLQDLCDETRGELISLQMDPLADLYRGFGESIGCYNKEIQIMLNYLKDDSDADLEVPFVLDESLSENLKVFLFFPYLGTDPLQFQETFLHTPSGNVLNFMKLEFLFAWVVDLHKPEAGAYVLKTRRVLVVRFPVLISVVGGASEYDDDDPVTVKLWAETRTDIQTLPQPVQIFAEVKKGWHPVRGAKLTATVHHPEGKASHSTLLDDGLAEVDITKDDGIYGRYFTSFTTPGYYNLYVEVTQGNTTAEIMKGPNGFCCGSSFTAVTAQSTGSFQRQSGPFSFWVPHFDSDSSEDKYPPSRVTDLGLSGRYDRIYVLHWTAAGDDLDAGSAVAYELKMFRDTAVVRHRFFSTVQELYSEMVESPPEATYGTTLNHAFELPSTIKGGTYYVAMRAIDDAGNAGEPSNAVPLWVEESPPRVIDCESEELDCEHNACNKMPLAERLQRNSADCVLSNIMILAIISQNIVSYLSLISSIFLNV